MQASRTLPQLIEDLKKSPPENVSQLTQDLIELLIAKDRTEQKTVAEEIFNYAQPLAAQKPLLFCYAKLLIAFTFFYSEKYDEALPMLAELQNLMNTQHDVNGAAVCEVMQGSIYRTFGNVDLALKSLWEGHEQLKSTPDFHFFLLASGIGLAGIYYDRKHYAEAIPLYESALALAKEKGKYYWIIYALHGLGKIYLDQKRFPEAKKYLDEAMQVAEVYNNPHTISNAFTELGNYNYAAGEYQQAENYHKQALELREKNGFIGAAVTNCIRLGEIKIVIFKPDEAIVFLEKGLELAERIKVKAKMYPIHLLLSDIYQRKGDHCNSLLHFKFYHELFKQVESEDSARRIKNVQLIFEAEQTKKENVIIKKQKEEIERKNIELQETIDELTLARIGKKARAITLGIAIIFFIFEDTILDFALKLVSSENYFISLGVKMGIIFSLSPINKGIEKYLLKKVIKKRKREVLV